MGTVVQTQFETFHSTIKLDMEDLKKVIEKRDMLFDELRAYLKKKSEEEKKPLITFTVFNQGSYPMGTGVEPAFDEHDYDIDAGIVFNVSKDDYTPIQVKTWVYEALQNNFRNVQWKKPCIRVQYEADGLPKFHVDFAVYSAGECNNDGKTYLAKGKPTLASSQNFWEKSEPQKLMELINSRFSDAASRSQFKRVIRYYKRWKDEKFHSVNGKPTGISLTALAYEDFKPFVKNPFNGQEEVDDHKACLELVKKIRNRFDWWGRITIHLPVSPGNDLFEKMSDEQCKHFKSKLDDFKVALEDAYDETDPHEACKTLKKQFGDDFPVPAKQSTAQSRSKAIVGVNESA